LNEYKLSISATAPSQSNWTLPFHPKSQSNLSEETIEQLGYNETLGNLVVEYCLAEPLSHACQLGLSNELLLIVTSCVFLKATLAAVVVWKMSSASLVTPGDAIESFIVKPDPRTAGLGTLDIVDSQKLEYRRRKQWIVADANGERYSATTQPRAWRLKRNRLWHVIPGVVWCRTYVLLCAGIAILAICLQMATYSAHGLL
jgi:hypothetical protein